MIEVTPDPDGTKYTESCAICRKPTYYWFAAKDVAVCKNCASKVEVSDVPSKRDWLVSLGAKLPENWMCNADRRVAENKETK